MTRFIWLVTSNRTVNKAARLSNLNFVKSINDRMEIITPLVQQAGKVLDLGVVESRRSRRATELQLERHHSNLLFRQVCNLNANCLGVDIDEEGIEMLKSQGFNVKAADVVTMNLDEEFDTIVAGEIIEHLPNVGQFLENMRRHLAANGTLVITTPNPFYSKQAWKIWRYNRPQVHEEHTCWFDPITLCNLCRMSGLNPYEIYWVQPKSDWLKALPSRFKSYFSHSFMILAKPAA